MIYKDNDNPKTVEESRRNEYNLKIEAQKEAEAARKKQNIEEQRKKMLKIQGKKHELEEIKRKIGFLSSRIRQEELDLKVVIFQRENNIKKEQSELNALKSQEQETERDLRNLA